MSLVVARLAVARGLRVLTTQAAGMMGRSDREQLLFAGERGLVLFTNNTQDFTPLSTAFEAEGLPHAGVVGTSQQVQAHHTGQVVSALLDFAAAHPDGMTPYLVLYLQW